MVLIGLFLVSFTFSFALIFSCPKFNSYLFYHSLSIPIFPFTNFPTISRSPLTSLTFTLIYHLSYRFFPYHLLTITSTFELLSTLCVCLDRHVDRVVRPVSEENGILVIEVTDGLHAHQANTSLRPGLLLVGRLYWPSIINRFVMHCPRLSRRLWQGSN